MDKENPSYYSVITADVRYDSRLTSTQKLLFSEITALSNKYGYCYAKNKYFADLYNLSKRWVSETIATLIEFGYIHSVIDQDNGNTRKIYIVKKGIEQENNTYETKVPDLWNKSSTPMEENFHTCGTKVPDINIKHNTKQNIKENKRKKNPTKPKNSKTKPNKKDIPERYLEVIEFYNTIQGDEVLKVPNIRTWGKNLDFWLEQGYTMHDIKKAILHSQLSFKSAVWYKDLEKLLRQRERSGNPVDRIQEAMNLPMPTKDEIFHLDGIYKKQALEHYYKYYDNEEKRLKAEEESAKKIREQNFIKNKAKLEEMARKRQQNSKKLKE